MHLFILIQYYFHFLQIYIFICFLTLSKLCQNQQRTMTFLCSCPRMCKSVFLTFYILFILIAICKYKCAGRPLIHLWSWPDWKTWVFIAAAEQLFLHLHISEIRKPLSLRVAVGFQSASPSRRRSTASRCSNYSGCNGCRFYYVIKS